MSRAWRCFIAIPLAERLRTELQGAVDRLRDAQADLERAWRWSPAEQWHVTLAFLGETDPAAIPGVEEILRDVVEQRTPFAVRTGGLGVFPTPRAARVLWYGVQDPDDRLRSIAADLGRALELDAAPLHAHVTLARSRHRHGARVGDLLRAPRVPAGELPVERALLYRSHTGREPAHYQALAEATLGRGLEADGTRTEATSPAATTGAARGTSRPGA